MGFGRFIRRAAGPVGAAAAWGVRRALTAAYRKRTGRRVLTVGTDCALGKKYTALALTRALQARGLAASFRATGQTGVMISGSGVAIDAVVSDFVAGVAEQLSPDNAPDHWDVIEGQGSLFHPAYAGVTLGLLHGSQPDALVLCHHVGREHVASLPDFPLPSLDEAIEAYLRAGRLTNAAVRCVGVSVNSSALSDDEWRLYRERVEAELGLPVVDPLRGGVEHPDPTHLEKTLRDHVAKEIGPIAKPRQILVVNELPKTRSGKIMRRLLRDVAENRQVGDATTLADPNVMKLISEGLASGKSED